uniref:Uncharacterized protein n=2 Tax=Parascaris univalens TaxID=6257 RepID=A0A915CAH0_PARUN
MVLLKCALLALYITEVITAMPVSDVDVEEDKDDRRHKRFICATCIDPCVGASCGGGLAVVDRPVPIPSPVPMPLPVPQLQPYPVPVPMPVPDPQPPSVVPVPVPVAVQSGCTTGICVSMCTGGGMC